VEVNIKRQLLKLSVIATLLGVASNSYASAFQLFEQNGAGVGDYDAGGAAEAQDASTAWYNPAGLVRLNKPQLVLSAVGIDARLNFSGEVQNYARANVTIFRQRQEVILQDFNEFGSTQGGSFSVVPAFHLAVPIGDRVVVALSTVAPFGLESDWPDDSIARYSATESKVEDIDITPSIAVKITDKFSIGAGIDFHHVDATFDQIIGFGTHNNINLDSHSDNNADSWELGWHGGLLYQFTPQTRVGLAYHSKVKVDADGKSKFYGPLAEVATNNATDILTSNNLNSNITLPGFVTLSIYHDIDDRWAVKASANYTEWSQFNNVPLTNAAGVEQNANGNFIPATLDVNVPQNFHNTWRISTGVNFKQTEKLMWRAGVGVDGDPTNSRDRNLRLPAGDIFAVAIGAHYQATKHIGFDGGYQHLFIKDGEINNEQTVGAQTTYVNGVTDNSADLVGLQMTVDFG